MKAFITGVTGQDGSYLVDLLLDKGYDVYGLVRRTSTPNYWRLGDNINEITLVEGDMTDATSLDNAIKNIKPDEVYNLAAQSFVGTSWMQPEVTANVNALGTLRLLEAIMKHAPLARFYQASTSEMFGNDTDLVQKERSRFSPRSPYAVSKLYAHWMTINYRQSYGLHASCGILFNHESPRRGIEFVTRKIANGVARIKLGLDDKIVLGNLNAKRDWGFAGDYVKAMWLMLQKDDPDDYVIATGESHSVHEFVKLAFEYAGINDWEDHVSISTRLMRPAELYSLKGDSTKAREKLGWKPTVTFKELVEMMVDAEMERVKKAIMKWK